MTSTTGASVMDSRPRKPTKPASVSVLGHDQRVQLVACCRTTKATAYPNGYDGFQISGKALDLSVIGDNSTCGQ